MNPNGAELYKPMNMKKLLGIFCLTATVVALSSCGASKAQQMAMADKIKVSCNPEVLTLVAGKIDAEITVTYPENYFAPKAIMTVTPVLVYEGGEQKAEALVYQGESVKDNYKVVPAEGGSVKEKLTFTYEKGMEKSWLELRSVVTYGNKNYDVPAIKVADGLNTTVLWVEDHGKYSPKADGYQAVLHEVAEGQILYDVNSANVKPSQLRSQSIKELQEALSAMAGDPRYTVTGTQVVAYASPEGGQELNAKLSDKRAGTAEKAWAKISGTKADGVDVKSIGQDWEGFQEAISKSDIADKNLILRVLSMYSDPAVREKEIRNMSQIYTEISKKVFPDLRRARFITEADYKNFSDEELEELAEKAIGTLDEAGLLRVAANSDNRDRKIALYQRAVQAFGSDKANFNIAALCLDAGSTAEAEEYLAKIKDKDADYTNAKGVCELQKGNLDAAAKLFNQAGTAEAKQNLGTIDILKGDYAAAAKKFEGATGLNAGLAFLLNGQYDKAATAITCKCAKSDYLRAVIAARKGDKAAVKQYTDAAVEKNPALKDKIAKDVEFAKYL